MSMIQSVTKLKINQYIENKDYQQLKNVKRKIHRAKTKFKSRISQNNIFSLTN